MVSNDIVPIDTVQKSVHQGFDQVVSDSLQAGGSIAASGFCDHCCHF